MELEKALKSDASDMDNVSLEGDGGTPVISSSATALQQAETKKEILHSLITTKSHSTFKCV